jgi:hypothetical protein
MYNCEQHYVCLLSGQTYKHWQNLQQTRHRMEYLTLIVGFETLIVVRVRITVFWDVTPCMKVRRNVSNNSDEYLQVHSEVQVMLIL